MNAQLRDEFARNIQKQITKDCTHRCFIKQDDTCLESCYDSHLKSLNIAAKKLREIGYKRHSRLITLAYGGFIDEWEKISLFNDERPTTSGEVRVFFEKNIYDESKNI